MRIPMNGKPPKLEKAEVRRMIEGVYLARRLARELAPAASEEVTAATAAYERLVIRKFGGDHLNEDGTLKEPAMRRQRDEAEAPKSADVEIPE